ncbi:hypothetical protein BN7_2752 [Wickerhamomyces ciferrii]|uniref:Uncharacterized protein n=1 Tax=Wickerhamomyces ciferrii (strain ATCC 14091 / BCRC 22168 / CBS 111 / JCM 3599 / NBRC 0793 / NRRL Y-1031 F-60-10) TaxID=1206466 RepID=K0KDL0_WICCF|nr:uncharacterized protein BN7_2752 [Wickerhamomyces ciferrii]CCH43205.1 hypothetical protein BN7_2752 [Wickerhamomyces ciferrii]
MTHTILHFLPFELQLHILGFLKVPVDIVSYLAILPHLQHEYSKHVRVIIDIPRNPIYSSLPEECLLFLKSFNNNSIVKAIHRFRGLVIVDLDICDTFALMDLLPLVYEIDEHKKKTVLASHLSLKFNIRNDGFSDITNGYTESFLRCIRNIQDGVITYLKVPFRRDLCLRGSYDSILKILEPSYMVKRLTIKNTNIKCLNTNRPFPSLDHLKLNEVGEEFSFDPTSTLPKILSIENCKAEIKLNSHMLKDSFTISYDDSAEREGTGIASLEDIEAPNLRLLMIRGSMSLRSIRRLNAKLLTFLDISSPHIQFDLGPMITKDDISINLSHTGPAPLLVNYIEDDYD